MVILGGMASSGVQVARGLVDLTRDRRAARYEEIAGWWAAVEAGEWHGTGQRSPSAWIATLTGESVSQCKRLLFLGERLTKMPHVADLFRLGLVSESAVSLIAEAWSETVVDAFARDELLLADWAQRRPYAEAKTMIEAWAARERANVLADKEETAFEARHLSVTKLGPQSMGKVTGHLDQEGTTLVRAALSMLSVPSEGDTRTIGQRHADALVTMAKFTLAHFEQPVGTKRRPPRAHITLSYEQLTAGTGTSLLDDELITAERARRLACDAGIHRLVTVGGSAIIDYGRQTRTVPDPLWQLLVARDRGCRFDGCEIPAELCDAHHAIHWSDGGETAPDTLVLLCWFHHHVLHEQHWRLEPLGAGQFELLTPNGEYARFSPPRLDVVTRPDQLLLVP